MDAPFLMGIALGQNNDTIFWQTFCGSTITKKRTKRVRITQRVSMLRSEKLVNHIIHKVFDQHNVSSLQSEGNTQ